MTFPELLTPRLRLRELLPDDADALLAVHADAEAMRWYGADPLRNRVEAEALIAVFAGWRQLPNPGTRWGLTLRESGELLGSCGLFGWNRGWQRCTLGYELRRSAWGQGLMREALQAVLDWGFSAQGMGLHRVEALIHPRNSASLKLAQGLGFETEGRLREVAFWGGRREDLLMCALLAQQHQAG